MKYFLVKFEADYADEFDVYGFVVMNEDRYNQFIEDLKKVKWPTENYFGTNESITFESLKDYMNSLDIQEIDEKEFQILKKMFGHKYHDGVDFGKFMDPGEYV